MFEGCEALETAVGRFVDYITYPLAHDTSVRITQKTQLELRVFTDHILRTAFRILLWHMNSVASGLLSG
jgi:hypothetical protein